MVIVWLQMTDKSATRDRKWLNEAMILDLTKNHEPSSIMMHGLNRLVRMPKNACLRLFLAEPLTQWGYARISVDMMKYASTNDIIHSFI